MALEHDSGAFIFFRGLKSTAKRSVMPTAFFSVLVGLVLVDFSNALGHMIYLVILFHDLRSNLSVHFSRLNNPKIHLTLNTRHPSAIGTTDIVAVEFIP